jgi:hypothetical protein
MSLYMFRALNADLQEDTLYAWSDSKVMRLVPKKSFILFIHQQKCGHLQSTSLVPAHTFSSSTAILCSIPGTHFVGCSLRPALQTTRCVLLTQNGVLSLSILLFEIEVTRCEIRWWRRLRHHRNAFGCQKLRSTGHPAVAVRLLHTI